MYDRKNELSFKFQEIAMANKHKNNNGLEKSTKLIAIISISSILLDKKISPMWMHNFEL